MEFNKKYDQQMMETAIIWSKKSYCKRRQVGAVIARDNNIISIGYNGTPTGLKKKIENKCDLCNGEGKIFIGTSEMNTCPKCGGSGKTIEIISDNFCEETVYICPICNVEKYKKEELVDENNVCKICKSKITNIITDNKTRPFVVHAEQNAIVRAHQDLTNCTIYVTTAPCPTCAILINQARIKRVVYLDDYHRDDGLHVLRQLGIHVEKYNGELFNSISEHLIK